MVRFYTNYFDEAWQRPDLLVRQAKEDLAKVSFDTFVATGVSGACMVSLFAHEMGKKWLIVRKDDDQSTHHYSGPGGLVGELGASWIFLDDFIATGGTFARVYDRIMDDFGDTTTFVGAYSYTRNKGNRFQSPAEIICRSEYRRPRVGG